MNAATDTAWAHGGESNQASVLVEQAIALIANDAGADRVAERIHDATDAPDQMGRGRGQGQGSFLARRWRPRHTSRQLEHPGGKTP